MSDIGGRPYTSDRSLTEPVGQRAVAAAPDHLTAAIESQVQAWQARPASDEEQQ
jgi:hypothetical protein